MDKEQAIDLLDNLIGMIEDNQDNDYDTAFRMAIDALKAQLFSEGTTSDLINRQAAIDAINHICPVDTEYDCTLLDRVDVRCVLSDLPSAQPGRESVEQIKWERDLAIRQLADLGYGLGEKPRTQDYKTDHGYMWLCPKCGLPVHSDFEKCVRCGYER